MKGFGVSSHLKVNDNLYYLESYFSPVTSCIYTKLSREGKILMSKRKEVDYQSLDEKKLMEIIKNIHLETEEELREWFSIYSKIKEEAPSEIYVKIGEKFLNIGLLQEAKELLEHRIKQDESYAPLFFTLGKVYYALKDYEMASFYLERAVSLAPNYANYNMWVARAYRKKKEFTRSLSYIRKALDINPSYGEAQFEMGLCLLELYIEGTMLSFKSIVFPFKSAELIDSRFKHPLYREGIEYLQKGELFEAKAKFEEFLEILEPHEVHNILNEFVLLVKYAEENKLPIILDDFILKLKELVQENPEYPDVHFYLALAYLLKIKNLLSLADRELENSVGINPDYQLAKEVKELLRNEIEGYLVFMKAIERKV